MKLAKLLGCFFVGMLVVYCLGWHWFARQPMLVSGQQAVVIYFKRGMSATALIDVLAGQRQLQCPSCARWLLKAYPKSASFQSGYYHIAPNLTWRVWFKQLARGEVLHLPFTIVEGQTTRQVIRALRQAPWLTVQGDIESQFIANCQICVDQHAEGMFLADTFSYRAGEDGVQVLQRAHQALLHTLNQLWDSPGVQQLPYHSPRELLIAASIIEKETAIAREKPLVAAVIVNRLRRGMRLQMDPTVIYGLGDRFRYPLTRKALQEDTPFNTYLHRGLPPQPISNVSLQSLDAAAHPAQQDYLYFYSVDGVQHRFSHTLKEHIRWTNYSK